MMREEIAAARGLLVFYVCFAFLVCLLLTGCVTDGSDALPVAQLSDDQAFAKARAALVASVMDPASLSIGPRMFRRTQAGWTPTSHPHDVVCGTVNGKNSYGAYTGPQVFAYFISTDKVWMDKSDYHVSYCIL